MTTTTIVTPEQFTLLMEKMDRIESVLQEQERRYQEMDELKRDLMPIANQAIKLSIDELAEIGNDFQLEDLLFLLKRLLRDTPLLFKLLDQLESFAELADESQVMFNMAFHQAIQELDKLERRGYFAFAREAWRISERIVTEFSEEDVRALADNIVLILTTVRNMTQPEIMALANNALGAIQEPTDSNTISTWKLLRELGDPQVRQGLAKMLNLLKAMAEKPNGSLN